MPLRPDVQLAVELSAICARHQFTQDPGPVIAELRATAGAHTEILAREIGTWVGFYDGEYTHTLAVALLDAFPEARPHVGIGQARRMRPIHGTG